MFRDRCFLIFVIGLASCIAEGGPRSIPPEEAPQETPPEVPPSDPPPVEDPPPTTPPPGPTLAPVVQSEKGRVRFIGGDRYAALLSDGLGIAEGELCKELGTEDCVTVHAITLGGVEPYHLGVLEALPSTTLTTPIAVDRIALPACEARVAADFADPQNARIFRRMSLDADGKLTNVEDPSTLEIVDALYRAILRRPAEARETREIRDFYSTVESEGSTAAARDWAVLACYVVATSMEALFF